MNLERIRIVAGVLLLAGSLWHTGCENAPAPGGPEPTCDIHAGPCETMRNGRRIQLDIRPKPVRSMRALTFELRLADRWTDAAPYIDLDMPAMRMGYNRVILTAAEPGVFIGDGVIVKCPSGLTTWKATVRLTDAETVDFIFDVRN